MKKRIILVILNTFITLITFAQTGSIRGVVNTVDSNHTLANANVVIYGTNINAVSDSSGRFFFNKIAPGTYSLIVSFIGYESKNSGDIVVKENETTEVNFTLKQSSNMVTGARVVAKPKTESINKVFQEKQNSAVAQDAIPAEELKKKPVKDAGDAIKNVTGATIQDNKFAVIRGLNDRYNAAYVNGAPLPSSESDRKAFAFNIFPSNMLKDLTILKTATPDLPAEFAGGIIQINTKDIPDKSFQSFSLGGGYNTITTGKTQLYYQGGKTDWLGFDDGTRAMPSVIPDKANFPTTIDDQATLAKQTNIDWAMYSKKFAPNFNFQYSMGYVDSIGKMPFGLIIALTYNKTNNYNETIRRGYTANGGSNNTVASQIDYDYLDKNYSEQVLAGALANFALKINKQNTIGFKNLFSINSDDRLISRSGTINPLDNNPSLLLSNAYWFTGNKIFASQLTGDHHLEASKIKINWVGSISDIERSIPNLRRTIYTRFKNINDPNSPNPNDTVYSANISGSNVGPDYGGGMFFSNNHERIYSFKIDAKRELNISEKISNELKVGFFFQNRSREFTARQLGYTKYHKAGGNVSFDENLLYLNNNEIFQNANLGLISPGIGGFKLNDGSKYSDNYNASSVLNAGYIMLDSKLKNEKAKRTARLVWGVRMEHFNQKLSALRANKSELNLDINKLDILPSANLILGLSKKQNLRVSYSQTLNRPEYRELAPFAFFDFNTNFVVSGNDSLQRALIHNSDVRWEMFPGNGQIFSISAFHKYFNNPIEQISRPDVSSEISFKNVPQAVNYGLELEFRTLLSSLLNSDSNKVLKSFTVYTNLAIVRSIVDVSQIIGSNGNSRPLQGQSPYVLNAGLQYSHEKSGFSTALSVNRTGQRIFIVGNVNEPDIWENGRTFLDFQLAKTFWKKKIDVRLNVSNILAQNQIFYQNRNLTNNNLSGASKFFNAILTGSAENENGYNKNEDDMIWSTNFGPSFSLSASVKF